MVSLKDGAKRAVWSQVRRIGCYPSWNEALEVELLRRQDVDLFRTAEVIEFCVRTGRAHAAAWYARCIAHKQHPSNVYDEAVRYFEKNMGPRSEWREDMAQ